MELPYFDVAYISVRHIKPGDNRWWQEKPVVLIVDWVFCESLESALRDTGERERKKQLL